MKPEVSLHSDSEGNPSIFSQVTRPASPKPELHSWRSGRYYKTKIVSNTGIQDDTMAYVKKHVITAADDRISAC